MVELSKEISVDPNITILIIEDAKELNEVLSMGLKNFGFKGEILRANSIEASLNFLKSKQIDLFIIDWLLPDGEGIELIKRLRQSTLYSETPIMTMTGREDITKNVNVNELKIDGLLIKPFSMDEFKNELAKLYGNCKHHKSSQLMAKDLNFLVVDDDKEIVEMLSMQLEKLGFKKRFQAYSLKESLSIIQAAKIDYIIIDWMLPDGTCVDMINYVNTHKEFKNIPIMVVTGRDSIDDLMTLIQLDVKDHLIKPFTFSEFQEKLNYCWIRKKQMLA